MAEQTDVSGFKEALGGDVVIPVTPLAVYELRQEIVRLKALLTGVVVAAGRMRDEWAESDKGRQNELWRALHTAAEEAHDEVYPLPTEDEDSPDGGCQHLWHETRTIKRAAYCPACNEENRRD